MTLFEFILVMVSLILAIGVTHLLEGFAKVARDRQRFDVDWITPVWGVFLFLLSIGHWWSLWDMREAHWTFPAFFFVLLPPTLLFLAVSLLAPTSGTETVSLAAEFEEIRVSFLTVLLLFVILVTWDGFVLGTEPAWNRLRILQLLMVGVLSAGLANRRWAVQRFVAIASLSILIVSSFVLRFLPGAFGIG